MERENRHIAQFNQGVFYPNTIRVNLILNIKFIIICTKRSLNTFHYIWKRSKNLFEKQKMLFRFLL